MSISLKKKKDIISNYGTNQDDTGSVNVQIALLTERIFSLTEHLKIHKKDFSARRGLLILIGQRSRFLKYVRSKSVAEYEALIKRLGIRK